jgi:hypothetical protein
MLTNEEKHNAEVHVKLQLYKDPAFKFYPSIGVYQLMFPIGKEGKLELHLELWYDPKGEKRGSKYKGMWKTEWYAPEDILNIPTRNSSKDIIDSEKLQHAIMKEHEEIARRSIARQTGNTITLKKKGESNKLIN